MIEVHIIAGDGNGGCYAEATLTLDREPEDVTDAECAEWREAIRKMFHTSFEPHEDPEQIIVYVHEVADERRDGRCGNCGVGLGEPCAAAVDNDCNCWPEALPDTEDGGRIAREDFAIGAPSLPACGVRHSKGEVT